MTASLHRRLTLTVLVLLAPVVLGLSIALDVVVAHVLERQADAALAARGRDLATALVRDRDGWSFGIDDRYVPEYAEDHGAYFQIRRDAGGDTIVRSRSLGDDEITAGDGTLGRPGFVDTVLPDGRPGRVVTVRFTPRVAAEGVTSEEVVLAVAESREDLQATIGRVRAWLWSLAAGALLVAVLAAIVAVRAGLRPLARVGAQVDGIDENALDRRLDVEDLPRELQAPLVRLNALLDRLQASFERERRFTADVSHELRTPLSAMRTVLELAASRQREPQEYQAAIDSALRVIVEVSKMVENLLLLARADAGQMPVRCESVRLAAFVDERWAAFELAARRRALSFVNEIDPDTVVESDPAGLAIIANNLLDNAARYTEQGGTIRVRHRADALLEVWDSGPLLGAVDRDRMFDRFWRADAARTEAGSHVGIGLSLARGVARALGLALVAVELDGGVAFRVVVDAAAAPSTGARRRATASA